MFRPTKKRRLKPRVVTTRDDDDDDEEEKDEEVSVPLAKMKTKKKSKKDKKSSRSTRPVVMSFDVVEDDDEPPSSSRKKRTSSKKKSGLGYGGSTAAFAQQDEQEEQNEPQQVTADAAGEEPLLYGKDALEQLRSEQRFKKAQKEKQAPAPDEVQQQPPPPPPTTAENKTTPLPAFVPLDSSSREQEEPIILTGDEAMSYNDDRIQTSAMDQTRLDASLLPPNPFLDASSSAGETTETTQAWEAEITRRAGVRSSSSSNDTKTNGAAPPSLTQMRQQVQSTMTHLKTQQDDLQTLYNRRISEMESTNQEVTRQEEQLDQTGKALEYYQVLREDLATWVGALRDLQTKVQPLWQAIHGLEVETSSSSCWQEWENDMVQVLRDADDVLDQVLGRQPPIPQEHHSEVDEFGRDVKSQNVLQRETRGRQRRRLRKQQQQQRRHGRSDDIVIFEEDSDATASDGELEERRERKSALVEALHIAVQELEEQYTSMTALVRVFEEWSQTYPEEYKQCYAYLSLADLAGVLVRVDLCWKFHPLHWQDNLDESDDESSLPQKLPWTQSLLPLELSRNNEKQDSSTVDETTPLHHVLDKVLVPAIMDLLEQGAYNVYSSKQSRSLATFCSQLCAMDPTAQSVSRLKTRVAQYLRQCLDNLAIPIVKVGSNNNNNNKTNQDNNNEELQEALDYATKGQVYRLKKLLINILRYWVPVLYDEGLLVDAMLDFLSNQFLFVLSFLQAEGSTALGSEIFAEVWEAVEKTKWLERGDLMLQAAPFRAAAVAYGQS